MSRYIDAEALMSEFPHDEDWDYPVNTNSYVVEVINSAPSIDIVRCKECKHLTNGDDVYGICYRCPNTRQMRYDDFCSRGEREGE